jgi:hypothetical protein
VRERLATEGVDYTITPLSDDELNREQRSRIRARIAAAAGWRTAGWAIGTSLHASSRVAGAAISGETPAELLQATGAEVRQYVRRMREIVDDYTAAPVRPGEEADGRPANGGMQSLRERGEKLLRRSADVDADDEA